MIADLVHAELPRFSCGVAPRGALRPEMIRTVPHRGVVECRHAARVRGADEGVKRERGGSIAVRELIEQRLQTRRNPGRGHGRLGTTAGALAGGGVAGGRDGRGRPFDFTAAESAAVAATVGAWQRAPAAVESGSRYTPFAVSLSVTSTVDTCVESKCTVMTRPFT